VSFVLDASLALAWCFRDEAHEAALRVRDRLTTEEAIVPDVLWDLEIWNALIGACRRGRIRSVSANADLLAQLPVRRLTAPLNAVLPLADRRGLSSYDALYLALALQERLPLASLDGRLVASARAEGLEVLGRE
jgi:predicted nucleic acid-binding protein